MANAQNTSLSTAPTRQLAWEGLLLGGKTGLLASTLYAIVGLLVIEILGRGVGFFSSPAESGGLGEFIIAFLTVVTMIFLWVVLPAAIIGAITGMYLGQLAKLLGGIMPRHLFISLCISSCLVVVILFHILFKIPITLSFQSSSSLYSFGVYETYPFVIGIPSVIYVLMGIWVGWKLYSKVDTRKDGQT